MLTHLFAGQDRAPRENGINASRGQSCWRNRLGSNLYGSGQYFARTTPKGDQVAGSKHVRARLPAHHCNALLKCGCSVWSHAGWGSSSRCRHDRSNRCGSTNPQQRSSEWQESDRAYTSMNSKVRHRTEEASFTLGYNRMPSYMVART